MRSSNWLAGIFNYFGDALERFNPAAFRFLAASLPYLTPVPVAWLTANSASRFLQFSPTVAFIFVFSLEGIGLWFTTLLVDAIVEWIRSWKLKAFVPVLMFAITVGTYVYLLVNLNVTLEQASGNSNPVLSRVITLMCFLPLITGVGNGYYKLKLEYKLDLEVSRERQERLEKDEKERRERLERDEKDRQERLEREIREERSKERLERLKLKLENSKKVSSNLPEGVESSEKLSSNFPTDWRKIRPRLTDEQVRFIAMNEPKDIVASLARDGFHISPRTASNWRGYATKEVEQRQQGFVQ